MTHSHDDISIGITGASGAIYAIRLLEILAQHQHRMHLMITDAARMVLAMELGIQLPKNLKQTEKSLGKLCGATDGQIKVYANQDWLSPVASGSSAPRRMVVVPCSTGTLSAIATGASNNLLERAADVVLKERGKLIVVPREMPLHSVHLRHMLTLSELGALVMPASPGFYHGAKSVQQLVDFVVARILEHLGVVQDLVPKWGYDTP